MKIWLATASTHLRKAALPVLLLLFAALYLWLPGVGSAAHTRLQSDVLALRTQAAQLERQADEVERLAALPSAPVAAEPLLVQVRAAAMRAGLGESVLRSDSSGPDQVDVSATALDFATWLQWLEELQTLNIRVDSVRIGATAVPGMVSVTASLLRPAAP